MIISIFRKHRWILTAGLVHLLVGIFCVLQTRVIHTWGDEGDYAILAATKLDPGPRHLLQGLMLTEWQPPFAYSVYNLFLGSDDATRQELIRANPNLGLSPEWRKIMKCLGVFNSILATSCVFMVYALCLQLGCSRGTALLAGLLLGFNPRSGFYHDCLWPEWLHIFLILGFMVLFFQYLNSRKPLWLIPAGAALAYAALTKSFATPFFLLIALAWTAGALINLKGPERMKCLGHLGLFAVVFAACCVPQMIRHHAVHGVFNVSMNQWNNLEMGLLPDATQARYREAADNFPARERAARQRVLAYVFSTNPLKIVARQGSRFVSVQLRDNFIYWGLKEKRWENPAIFKFWAPVAVFLSFLIVGFGLAGLLAGPWRNPRFGIVAGYTLFYTLLILVISHNPRFFVQLIPFLCIMAGVAANRLPWNKATADSQSGMMEK